MTDAPAIPSMADAPFAVQPPKTVQVTVVLAGEPQGKGRARAFRRGNFIGHYTPAKTRTYEGMIRTAAMEAMGGRAPIDEPVTLRLHAIFGVPRSWALRRRQAAFAGDITPAKKPDIDNILKAWIDSLNGVVYRDDAQIVEITCEKRYGLTPQVMATVTLA